MKAAGGHAHRSFLGEPCYPPRNPLTDPAPPPLPPTHLHAGIKENLAGNRQVFLQLRHVLAVTALVQCRYSVKKKEKAKGVGEREPVNTCRSPCLASLAVKEARRYLSQPPKGLRAAGDCRGTPHEVRSVWFLSPFLLSIFHVFFCQFVTFIFFDLASRFSNCGRGWGCFTLYCSKSCQVGEPRVLSTSTPQCNITR